MPEPMDRAVDARIDAYRPQSTPMFAAIEVRKRRRDRRRAAAGAAALSVAAVAAVSLAVPLLTGNGSARLAPPAAGPSGAPAADGQQAVVWHGVQLYVPEHWHPDDLRCHEPQSDTVVLPGVRDDCLAPYVSGLTIVEYSAGADKAPGGRPVEVSGQAGRRATLPLTEEPGVREVLVLPDLNVTVSVRSPDPARAKAILDTAQVVEQDARGCPSALAATTPPRPDVPGAADRVLPGDPDRVVVCQYGDLRIERSAELPDYAVRRFQAALDAAPVGTSPSRVGVSVSAELCPEYDRAPLVLIAIYPDGGRLQVYTRQNSCTGPDPDNGARQVVVEGDVMRDLGHVLYQGGDDRLGDQGHDEVVPSFPPASSYDPPTCEPGYECSGTGDITAPNSRPQDSR